MIHLPERLRKLTSIVRAPVGPETRELLRSAWRQLPQGLRTSQQFLGRQYAGCGATIGAMPRCDFACRGCYLGAGANRVPSLPLSEIQRQLRRIRAWLGEGGNVQLTDGEITLRPEEELIELIRSARSIGLVPMLMTHGDRLRQEPALLRRLVEVGGLTELSIHIDSTQRGRRGRAYRYAQSERELLPLRDEFAELIRGVRRETGLRLEAATTFTATRENLDEIPSVVRWHCQNADAFKMISFQPVAQVGRTQASVAGPVSVQALWEQIAKGLPLDLSAEELERRQGWLGHPSCSRFVQALVEQSSDGSTVFHPLFSADSRERRVIGEWLRRFGGLTFRLDSTPEAVARLCGVVAREPLFIVREVLPFLLRGLRRLQPRGVPTLLWDSLRGEVKLHYLNVVSHHFMSRAELETALGKERLASCAFRVPMGDQLVSMCEVNAQGIRERLYAEIKGRDAA